MKYPSPRPPQFQLRVRKSDAGLGLFAQEQIPSGRFVIEYWGKLMSDEAAQKIGGRYLFEIGNGKTVEGSTRKNTARYANHSCRPNCEIRTTGNRVYIFSIKKIKPGDEITYDYGEEYHDHYIKPHGCRCGACTRRTIQRQR